jgi:predicted GNAT superfamily acetyltransferase
MAPLMLTGAHGRPLTWAQARAVAELMKRGFALARRLTPLSMRLTSWQPALLVAALLWVLSRTPVVNALGARGPGEARALLAAMKLPDPLRDGAGD